MHLLSIQSAVASGAVGNSAAVFCLQRLGIDVARIDTVRFSNHPGHGGFAGGPADAGEMAALVEGIDARGLLAGCTAVLSGYLGAGAQGPVVADAVARVKRANPQALYALDPVMGDRGRIFVKPGVVDAIRSLEGHADILFPNAFELSLLTGREVVDVASAVSAAASLRKDRPSRIVVATSLPADGGLGTLAAGPAGTFLVETPAVDHPAFGAGDGFAALFLARYLPGRDLAHALSFATSSIHAVVAATAKAGLLDLALVANQAALADPPVLFQARPIA
jgi:pyridoxine kinase